MDHVFAIYYTSERFTHYSYPTRNPLPGNGKYNLLHLGNYFIA